MDQVKIGKFISVLRKQKGLTQSELGEKVGVTSKAVSKWERGICIPDVTKLNIVAGILNTSVVELLNGEGEQKNDKINEITKDSIKYYNDLSFKKTIKKIATVSIITILILIILVLFEINNFGKVSVYNILPTNDDYFCNGNIIKTNEGQILILTNVVVLNEYSLTKKGYAFEFSLFIDDNLIERQGDISLYEHDNNDNKLLSLGDYVKDISIYVIDDLNQIINSNTLNEKQLKLIITFINDKLDIENYEMKFLLNKSFSNNRITYDNNNI